MAWVPAQPQMAPQLMTENTWSKLYKFRSVAEAKQKLRAKFKEEDWVTPPSGARGSNSCRMFAGVANGDKFKIQSKLHNDKSECYLWVANDNESTLTITDAEDPTDDDDEVHT